MNVRVRSGRYPALKVDGFIAAAAERRGVDQWSDGRAGLDIFDVFGGAIEDRITGRRCAVTRAAADLKIGDRVVRGQTHADVEGSCGGVAYQLNNVAVIARGIDQDIGPHSRAD